MQTIIIKSLEEMGNFVSSFVENLPKTQKKALIIGLSGDLGSGKTTFVQGIAQSLGIKDQITSPTFVIQKRYEINSQEFDFKNLIHIDAYRLESGEDLLILGWEEIKNNPENIIFIEWPEKVSEVLPKDIINLNFKFVDEGTREIRFKI